MVSVLLLILSNNNHYYNNKWGEKQLFVRFIQLINNISREKIWTWLRKGNFKRETESLLIAV